MRMIVNIAAFIGNKHSKIRHTMRLLTIDPGLALATLPPANEFAVAMPAEMIDSALLAAHATDAADTLAAIGSAFTLDTVAVDAVTGTADAAAAVDAISVKSCVGTAKTMQDYRIYYRLIEPD